MSQTQPVLATDDVVVSPDAYDDAPALEPTGSLDDMTDNAPEFFRMDAAVIGDLPPPNKEDIDLSLEDIVERCNRTDAHLQKWRNTSVDRKLGWEEEEAARLEVAAQRKGWFYLGAAGGTAAALLAFCTVLAVTGGAAATAGVVAASSMPSASSAAVTPAKPVATTAVSTQAASSAAPAVVAPVAVPERAPEGVADVAPPQAAPVVAAVVAKEAPSKVASPKATKAATKKPVAGATGPLTMLEDGRVWTEGSYAWTEALVAERGAALAWFDASGAEVLDRVPCSGRDGKGYRCISGRSAERVQWALSQGAQPGAWTVKACSDTGCSVLGTVDIPVK